MNFAKYCNFYNTTVTITAEQNGWGKTSYGGKTGWISLQYTAKVSSSATSTVISASGYQQPFKGGYTITCVYGKKGSWSCGYHSGLDMVATGDKTVYPVHSGKVVSVNKLGSSYGNHVLIDHGDGYLSLYAHLEYVSVSEKQQVTTSTSLGKMGWTGNVKPAGPDGAHLHLEIHKGSYRYPATINPQTFLNERI